MKGKRFTALLLGLIMIISLLPSMAWADIGTGWDDDCRGNVITDTAGSITYGRHNWVLQGEVPGNSCNLPGIALYACSYCGASAERATPAPGHSWGSWNVVKQATCVSTGARTRTCTVCGETQTESTPATAHSWGGWVVTSQATCITTGTMMRSCAVCGETQTEIIPTTDHTWGSWTLVTEATDHSAGIYARTCQVCGQQQTTTYDPEGTLRRGNYGEEVRKLQEELICYGVLEQGDADGSFGAGTENAVKKLQEAEGLTADGVAWPQTQSFLGHQFGEWETIQELSDFSSGVEQRVCERCGYTETREEWPSPIYVRGNQGEGVRALQQALNDAGYNCGSVDGDFGGNTEAAVKAIEEDHGVTEDGIAWPGVLKWLGLLSSNQISTRRLDVDAAKSGNDDLLLIVEPGTFKLSYEYAADDEVTFKIYLRNETSNYMNSADISTTLDGKGLNHHPLKDVESGSESGGIRLNYTLSQEDIDKGSITFQFSGLGYFEGIDEPIPSNEVTVIVDFTERQDMLEFLVDDIPAKPYGSGDLIQVHGMLHNVNKTDSVRVVDIEAVTGESFLSDETWMHESIAPDSYHNFTLNIPVTDSDVERGWGYTRLYAEAMNDENNNFVSGYLLVLYAIQKEGASILLLIEDSTGMGGLYGSVIPVRMAAFNNGTVDLKVWDFLANTVGGAIGAPDYNDFPEEFYTLFPAGASKAFTNYVCINTNDLEQAQKNESHLFDRGFELYADRLDTGERLSARLDDIYFTLFDLDLLNENVPGEYETEEPEEPETEDVIAPETTEVSEPETSGDSETETTFVPGTDEFDWNIPEPETTVEPEPESPTEPVPEPESEPAVEQPAEPLPEPAAEPVIEQPAEPETETDPELNLPYEPGEDPDSFEFGWAKPGNKKAELTLEGETEEYKSAYYPGDPFSTSLKVINTGEETLYGLTITLSKWNGFLGSKQLVGIVYQEGDTQPFAPADFELLTDDYIIQEEDAQYELLTLAYEATAYTADGTPVSALPFDLEFEVKNREPEMEPATRPGPERPTEPATQPVPGQPSEPATQPMPDQPSEPATQPMPEQPTEPTTGPSPESPTQPTPEPPTGPSLQPGEPPTQPGDPSTLPDEPPTLPGDPSTLPGEPPTSPQETPEEGPATTPGDMDEHLICVRTLVAVGEEESDLTLHYCDKHDEVHAAVKDLLDKADAYDAQLEAWQQSIDLWTKALNEEYDDLAAEADISNKPIIVNERVTFYLWLVCYQELLEKEYADDPVMVASAISEQLMNKTVDLCYEIHTSPSARVDSLVTGSYTFIEPVRTADKDTSEEPADDAREDCLRVVSETESGVYYQELLCKEEQMVTTEVLSLLKEAQTSEETEAAILNARKLWLARLNDIVNEQYLAADDTDKDVIAAERTAYGDWLKARKSFLSLLYSDQSVIVDEVLMQSIRGHVIDLCEKIR